VRRVEGSQKDCFEEAEDNRDRANAYSEEGGDHEANAWASSKEACRLAQLSHSLNLPLIHGNSVGLYKWIRSAYRLSVPRSKGQQRTNAEERLKREIERLRQALAERERQIAE
jgi:hypothetical protein